MSPYRHIIALLLSSPPPSSSFSLPQRLNWALHREQRIDKLEGQQDRHVIKPLCFLLLFLCLLRVPHTVPPPPLPPLLLQTEETLCTASSPPPPSQQVEGLQEAAQKSEWTRTHSLFTAGPASLSLCWPPSPGGSHAFKAYHCTVSPSTETAW